MGICIINSHLIYLIILILNIVSTIIKVSRLHIDSYGTNRGGFGCSWVWKWIGSSSWWGITNWSWGGSKLVQLAVEVSLENMGFFVSNPSFVVLVIMVPWVFEVGFEISWNLWWLEFMGSLENGTWCDLGIVLHEELLAGLVSRWSSSFLWISGINIVHNLIFVGSIVSRDVHLLPGGLILISSLWIRIVMGWKLKSVGESKEGTNNDYFWILHIFLFVKIN